VTTPVSDRPTPRSGKGKRGRGRFSRLTERQERAAALQQLQQSALPPASVEVPRGLKRGLPLPEVTARVLKRPSSDLPSTVSDFFPASLKELAPGKREAQNQEASKEQEPSEDQPKSEGVKADEAQYIQEGDPEENNLSSLLNLMPQIPRSRMEVQSGQKRAMQKWTEQEKDAFLHHFAHVGKDWDELCERIPTKTAAQIKNFFQNYKTKYNLQAILDRLERDGPPTGLVTPRAAMQDLSGQGDAATEAVAGKDKDEAEKSSPKVSLFNKSLPKATAKLNTRELMAATTLKQASTSQDDSEGSPKPSVSASISIPSAIATAAREGKLSLTSSIPRPPAHYLADDAKLSSLLGAISSADRDPTPSAKTAAEDQDSNCSTPSSVSSGAGRESGGVVPTLPLNLNLNPSDLDVATGAAPKGRQPPVQAAKPSQPGGPHSGLTVPQLRAAGLPLRVPSPARGEPKTQAAHPSGAGGHHQGKHPGVSQVPQLSKVGLGGAGAGAAVSRSQSPVTTAQQLLPPGLQVSGSDAAALSSLQHHFNQAAAQRKNPAKQQVSGAKLGPQEDYAKLRNLMATQQQELRMKAQQHKGGLSALEQIRLQHQHQQQQQLFHQKLLEQHMQQTQQAHQKNKAPPQQALVGPAAKRQRTTGGVGGKKDEVTAAAVAAAAVALPSGGTAATATRGAATPSGAATVRVSGGPGAVLTSGASLASMAHPAQTQQQLGLARLLAAQKSQAELAAAVQASQQATVVRQQHQQQGAAPASGSGTGAAAPAAAAVSGTTSTSAKAAAEHQARLAQAQAQAQVQATHQYLEMARQQQLMQVQQQHLRMNPNLFYQLHHSPQLQLQYAQIQHAQQLAAAQTVHHHQQQQARQAAQAHVKAQQAQQLKAKADAAAKAKVSAVGTHPALTSQLLRTAQGMHPRQEELSSQIYDFTPHLLRQLQQPMGPHTLTGAAFTSAHPSLSGLDAQQLAQYQARLGAQRQAVAAAASATRGPSPTAPLDATVLKNAEVLQKGASEIAGQLAKGQQRSATSSDSEGQRRSPGLAELQRAVRSSLETSSTKSTPASKEGGKEGTETQSSS